MWKVKKKHEECKKKEELDVIKVIINGDWLS